MPIRVHVVVPAGGVLRVALDNGPIWGDRALHALGLGSRDGTGAAIADLTRSLVGAPIVATEALRTPR